ncbi:NUDIX hydrolase [Candidatus Xianfuyuplasma coldseepsis]|uniref:NUDIX domain-containing protein n=1 Tax=Candidatus Xianfuyuplasma coldseepsis TaxID=2782163 RepID=A0A7L7KT24_9MOLU|nr:NUDIX domain-containing protein [Xianfuyuplasma coldseepsis]QMS85755.1 NUDIX domain-containing protein [Xianfuyuplasma coldseepsis]
MKIEVFDGNLESQDIVNNTMRIGCRAVVLHDSKILTVYDEKWDITSLPGGGLEPGETITECVIREVKEETGVIVTNPVEMVRVIEHFDGNSYTSIYFKCDYVNSTNITSLTALEKEVNLLTRWVTIENLMTELSTNRTLHEHGGNIHDREFLGLINSI